MVPANMTNKTPTSITKIISLTILVIILGLMTFFEVQTRSQFAKVDDVLKGVRESTMQQIQASEQTDRAYAKGNGILSTISCLPDVRCPLVQGTWTAQVEPGKEHELGTKLVSQSGHTITKQDISCTPVEGRDCYTDGSNNETNIKVTLKKVDLTKVQIIVAVDLR